MICFDFTFVTIRFFFKDTVKFFFTPVDFDECESRESNDCDFNALCTNADGSYVCRCNEGYTGDGKNCTGIISSFSVVHYNSIANPNELIVRK